MSFRDEDVWASPAVIEKQLMSSGNPTGVSSGPKPRGRGPQRPFLFTSSRTPGAPLPRRSPLKVIPPQSARLNGAGVFLRSPVRFSGGATPMKAQASPDSLLEKTTDKLTTSFLVFGEHRSPVRGSPGAAAAAATVLTPPTKSNGLRTKAVRIKLTENKRTGSSVGSGVKSHLLASPSPARVGVQLAKFVRSPQSATPSKKTLQYTDAAHHGHGHNIDIDVDMDAYGSHAATGPASAGFQSYPHTEEEDEEGEGEGMPAFPPDAAAEAAALRESLALADDIRFLCPAHSPAPPDYRSLDEYPYEQRHVHEDDGEQRPHADAHRPAGHDDRGDLDAADPHTAPMDDGPAATSSTARPRCATCWSPWAPPSSKWARRSRRGPTCCPPRSPGSWRSCRTAFPPFPTPTRARSSRPSLASPPPTPSSPP